MSNLWMPLFREKLKAQNIYILYSKEEGNNTYYNRNQ